MQDKRRATSEQEIKDNLHLFNDLDPAFAEAIVENVLGMLNEIYFRAKFIGFEEDIKRNNPDAPVILVSNHSGMAFPWDAVVYTSAMLKRVNYDTDRVCRILIAPVLSNLGMFRPYMIHHFWKRCGGVTASYLNFETLMQHPSTNVLVYPEGVPGLSKGFNNRYKLQRLATSFVKMSLKYDTDIVPFSTVNGEYINPYAYNVQPLSDIAKKLLGLPFLPLSLLIVVLILQPWMFYFAAPAQLTFVKGKRIRRKDLTDKKYENLSEEEIIAIRDKVQIQVQSELTAAVDQYGQKPYDIKEFLRLARKNIKILPFLLPFGWPLLFGEFYRQFQNKKEINLDLSWSATFRILLKKPILLCYCLPLLGWIPIWIVNAKMKKEEKEMKEQQQKEWKANNS